MGAFAADFGRCAIVARGPEALVCPYAWPMANTGKASADELHQQGLSAKRALDLDQAYARFEAAAILGHADARMEAARLMLYGLGTAQDPLRATRWFEEAERAGNAIAGYFLALVALGDMLVPRDGRIDQRILAAVRAEYPPALLAAAVRFGRDPSPGAQALCIELLQRGVALGDPLAATLLEPRLRNGEGCDPDPRDADALRAWLDDYGIGPLPATSARAPQRSPRPRVLGFADAWQAPEARRLSQRPDLVAAAQLLSADECRLLMATARPRLERSRTIDDDGDRVEHPSRTSSDAGFDPVHEDFALRVVQVRMARLADAEFTCSEPLIVLRYAPGEQFHPHRDYIAPSSLAGRKPEAGNRAATVCAYLNDVEGGGATRFPAAGMTVPPRAGAAIAFRNLKADGQPDPDSLHAGLPVERGEKWLATLWLRQRRWRGF